MSQAPRVSVVMCAYNGLGLIEQAIGDIVAQSLTDWELVISDDGSTDGTRDYLRLLDDPRIRVILRDSNLGYVANKNAAFASARGAWLTQLDQDDRSAPDRLERQLAALERTGLQMCATGFRRIGLDGAQRGEVGPADETVIAGKGKGDYPFWFPSIMASRAVHEAIGDFPLYFAGAFGDDLYWTMRANDHFPILCLPQLLYAYRESAGSITSTLDDPRKLVMGGILRHLVFQRRATGTDDLERGDLASLAETEKRILADPYYLAEQYRTYAARSIDQGRFAEARRLLGKALVVRPWSLSQYRTVAYYIRARLLR